METVNYFRCIDYIIHNANKSIIEKMIKDIYLLLKSGTSDSRKSWFSIESYKMLPNEVEGRMTTAPEKNIVKMNEVETVKKFSLIYNCRNIFIVIKCDNLPLRI